jgi:ABC-2 type transport system ATP-binding protein
MPVRANLSFFARLYGLPAIRVDQVLMQVGLADQATIAITKLSEGLQRRLALGRALLHQPGCLVLAEPFARCDEATINLLSGVIRSQADDGAAVLILAASQARLPSLCDTIYLMNEGRISEARSVTEAIPANQPFKIPVRGEDKVVLVNPSDILYADASEGRAFLVMADGRLPTQFTLHELENRLARSGFFRAHRSFLVNLQHVKEVIPFTRNSYSLRLDDRAGSLIPLSKAAAAELKELLGY